MKFNVSPCGCYGCWFDTRDIVKTDHWRKRNSILAQMDNDETDRQLFELGLPSLSLECEEGGGCKLTHRPGTYHGGDCIHDPEFESIAFDFEALFPGEEVVGVLR